MVLDALKSRTFWIGLVMAASPLVPAVGTWMNANGSMVSSIWGIIAVAVSVLTKNKFQLIP